MDLLKNCGLCFSFYCRDVTGSDYAITPEESGRNNWTLV
jgi:hypothetical protein